MHKIQTSPLSLGNASRHKDMASKVLSILKLAYITLSHTAKDEADDEDIVSVHSDHEDDSEQATAESTSWTKSERSRFKVASLVSNPTRFNCFRVCFAAVGLR